ncbi:MAG: phosphoglycerate dehydrogenase [Dehalococcoidia bacterium]
MATAKVAVLSNMVPDQLELFLDQLPSDLDVTAVDNGLSDEEKIALYKDVDATILVPADVSVNVVRACPRLKLIQTLSAGYDRLDIKALGELGIPIANNGGANSIAVSEQTIGLMLMVSKKMAQAWFTTAKERKWRGNISPVTMHEITGKTVGIVGLGRIGKQVARRLKGFSCEVIYHDVVPCPPELEEELAVKSVPFDELVSTSDIITMHVPLTPLTRKMIGQRELEMMKPDAILINACRGPVVDETALYEALTSGRIAGAGLDVLEVEPTPVDNPILGLDNVVVTPHLAGSSYETVLKGAAWAYENIQRVMAGQPPESMVTPDY